MKRVVDTNVPLIANGRSTAGPDCELACVRWLRDFMAPGRGHLVLDDRFRILGEYRHRLDDSGQPGVGDAFLKWALTHMADPRRCTRVEIHPRGAEPQDFEEFPTTPELADFDPADHKFVAVSAAHPEKPPICQGFDSKWWGWQGALRTSGIEVEFLCPEEIARKFEEKSSKG
jgi:hypothetical protein